VQRALPAVLARGEPGFAFADWGAIVVTERAPSDAERRALLFAWKVSKHVKSNAIVFALEGQTVGVGAGQRGRDGEAAVAYDHAHRHLFGRHICPSGPIARQARRGGANRMQ